jgi:uncharacterized protein YjlB
MIIMKSLPLKIYCKDNGLFPNSRLPVLLYKNAVKVPLLFPASHIERVFARNNWGNFWQSGIFRFNHYHSTTHEAMAVIQGHTVLLLGGENGQQVKIEKGDLLIIPAGVAHRNLGKENDVKCIGAYPEGREYDMNYGNPGERPKTDNNIAALPVPEEDPLLGRGTGIVKIWSSSARSSVKQNMSRNDEAK